MYPARFPALALSLSALLAACATPPPQYSAPVTPAAYMRPALPSPFDPLLTSPQEMYAAKQDGAFLLPAIDTVNMDPEHVRQVVDYPTSEAPGTVVVDQTARFLYFVLPGGKAIRYAVAVGPLARAFPGGEAEIARKAEWPRWIPTPDMIERNPQQYGRFADGVDGGLHNPMGARALYMHQDGIDTYYRVHGTNDPSSIGRAVSAGCIRLLNQDIIDLHDRVEPGAKIVVM